ncbi:hypothetical protein [Agrococcus sp. DT81.2]|uniref:hypothetical protein n=1 Tax=Agrococcus sp. DT81.2 TaxID=3393414 RepID=UPI003CE4BCB8
MANSDRNLHPASLRATFAGQRESSADGSVSGSVYLGDMNWGSVADWVGAFGTSGALLLGVFLYFRERALSRRRDVDELVTWQNTSRVVLPSGASRDVLHVHVKNQGPRPVRAPMFFCVDRRGGYASQWLSETGQPMMVPPGRELRVRVSCQPANAIANYVLLRSAEGRRWIRPVDEHRYLLRAFGDLLVCALFLWGRADGDFRSWRSRRKSVRLASQ